ncbi:MAG: hypothetical protein K2X00_09980 [Nitrospiraceae bacterium]|nr:hypothetical protein [Nitrospiraceae bacterium]
MPAMLLFLRCLSPVLQPSAYSINSFLVSLVLGGLVPSVQAAPALADPAKNPVLTQTSRSAKTASPHIGSAMAVLATLQDAGVLPPEGTPEANHIIRFVIQFQSVFTKSDDPAVQEFARQALAHKYGDQAADIVGNLRTTGWTADILERLSDEEARQSSESLHTLAQGFAPFNLSVEEFHRFMQLVRDARQAFRTRGLEFQHIFSSRRKEMPGAESS